MRKTRFFHCLMALFLSLPFLVSSQDWNFIKEENGIKVYTRNVENSSLKSYRGVVDMHCKPEKINNLLGNGKNFSWWDKNVKDIKVIAFEKDKFLRYYLVYDLPWPLTDRDLCVEATITLDPVTGTRTVFARPLEGVIPDKPDLIRIKKYWQKWVVTPKEPGVVSVTLEGFVDPAGSIPAWLYNMVITNTPIKVISSVRKLVE
jgi:hypothetical protein